MSLLAELVEVVIGVNTHKGTHPAGLGPGLGHNQHRA